MAIFLGVVISYPLELKIFDDEIQVKIEEMKSERLREYIAVDQQRVDSLEQVLSHLKEAPISIYDTDITSGNEKLNNLMQHQKDLRANIDHENAIIANLNAEINKLRNNDEDNKNDAIISQKISAKKASQTKRNGFQTELKNLQATMSVISPQVEDLIRKKTDERESSVQRLQNDIDALKTKIENADKDYNLILKKNFDGFQARCWHLVK